MCTSDKSVNCDVECPWFSLVGEDCNLVSWVLRVFFICPESLRSDSMTFLMRAPLISWCWFPEDRIHGSHLEQRRLVGNPIVLVPCNVLVAIAQIQSLRKVFVKRTIWYRVYFSKGSTQTNSKYGIGPFQQDKIARYTGPTQSYQWSKE